MSGPTGPLTLEMAFMTELARLPLAHVWVVSLVGFPVKTLQSLVRRGLWQAHRHLALVWAITLALHVLFILWTRRYRHLQSTMWVSIWCLGPCLRG